MKTVNIINTNILFSLVLLVVSCGVQQKTANKYDLYVVSNIKSYNKLATENPDKEFVDIEKHIPGINLDIRYATKNNFTGQQIYESPKAYIRKPVADALLIIQDELNNKGLAIKIYDAYRPYSATVKFYEVYPDKNFVASPKTGSVHNRGCAVDLSLINIKTGKELEMPTLFDDFTEKASHSYMDLPAKAIENRKLLKDIMTKYGFIIYEAEWWHYSYKDWKEFEIMDISFEELKQKGN
ncbi:MAG: M15 family metallopeptidase [Bacteroidota bacterium]